MSYYDGEAWLPEGSNLSDGGKYDGGEGFRYTPRYADAARTQILGIWFWHPCRDEEPDARVPGTGAGPNGRTNQKWGYSNIETPEQLTLEGSILCGCGYHGFLENGKWRDC